MLRNFLFNTVGEDFGNTVIPSFTISFPVNSAPGETVCGFVSIQNDNLVEGTEFFTVTAQDPGLFPSGSSDVISILDNDGKKSSYFLAS